MPPHEKGNRKGSNHYFTLTWHRESYRGYCIGCANYNVLFGYLDKQHYCADCKNKINKAIRKQKINVEQTERAILSAFIEKEVEKIQKETADEKKFTEKDYKLSIKKWRGKRKTWRYDV